MGNAAIHLYATDNECVVEIAVGTGLTGARFLADDMSALVGFATAQRQVAGGCDLILYAADLSRATQSLDLCIDTSGVRPAGRADGFGYNLLVVKGGGDNVMMGHSLGFIL